MSAVFILDPNAIVEDVITLLPTLAIRDQHTLVGGLTRAIAVALCYRVEQAFNSWLADATNVETHMLEWASIRLMEEWQRRQAEDPVLSEGSLGA